MYKYIYVQPLPTWMHRPYLSGRFVAVPASVRHANFDAEARTFPGTGSKDPGSIPALDTYSPGIQHAILTRELLLALTGVEGTYIRVAAVDRPLGEFVAGKPPVYPTLRDLSLVLNIETSDRSVASQISLLLPICENAIRIREFIKVCSRYEYGCVSHALTAGMKVILREFDLLVAQLEMLEVQAKLSIQKFVFHLQPARATLRVLDRLCTRLRDSNGGRMLDILFTCLLEQGDDKTRELHSYLFKMASAPFISMLQNWLYKGELNDPYHEFMIQENSGVSRASLVEDFNAQYWEERYSLRLQHVPKILKGHSNSLAQMILTAGKYLNVVRGCHKGFLLFFSIYFIFILSISISSLSLISFKIYTFIFLLIATKVMGCLLYL